ncbi:hypothetical protein V8D89_005004 [Ganoderma adspersum]
MHEVDEQTFSARVPGPSPTATNRAKFVKPDLTGKGISEHAIGVELTKTIKSVLEAVPSGGLRVLHTPPHKVRGALRQTSDAFNRVGIYLDNETARRITTLTAADGAKKNLTRKELESGDFGHASWYWMAVLGVVKSLENQVCAFHMGRTSSVASSDSSSLSEEDDSEASDDDDDDDDDTDSQADSSDSSSDTTGSESHIRRTRMRESAIVQLADYMHNLSTHQHRVFSYGFYVQWRWARLLYFDHTGVLVSEPFDWTETSSPLHNFVWKLAHMTLAKLGYDPTAQEAAHDDLAKVFRKATDPSLHGAVRTYVYDAFFAKPKEHDHSRGNPKDRLDREMDEAPIYKLTVPSSRPSSERDLLDSELSPPTTNSREAPERAFLVGRPHFAADSLVGRCTRGYIAFDLTTGEFCFLKDCWRSIIPGRTWPEHLVYDHLHRNDVKLIPTVVCGGDVSGPLQRPAVAHTCFSDLEGTRQPVPRVHYRIVIRDIGLRLSEFTHFGELNHVFLCALAAHYSAWEKAGVLHRDVSVGNILIDPVTRHGLLIDWGNSCLRSELDHGPAAPGGTWRFLSALALKYPRKPYRLSDDIESFVHAYRWMVLGFHDTNLMDLPVFVQTQYEECVNVRVGPGPGAADVRVRVGGDYKMMSHNAPRPVFWVRGNDRLQRLLEDLAAGCYQHYQSIDMERMDDLYGIPIRVGTESSSEPPTSRRRQPDHIPPPETDTSIDDEMEDLIKSMPRIPYEPPPPPPVPSPQGVDPLADPCDVDGFLSTHMPLVKVFTKWAENDGPRHEDQFLLAGQDEPVYYSSDSSDSDVSTLSGTEMLNM